MRKSKLRDGTPMLVFKINSFVTDRVFAIALTDHFYGKSEEFDFKIGRKEAVKILERRLFFHGIKGEHEDGFFEASFEFGEIYNRTYSNAKKWVLKNYPHLLNTPNQ